MSARALAVVTTAAVLLLGQGAAVAAAVPGSPLPSAAAGEPQWAWPIPTPVITRGYEAPAHRYGAGHRGIDLEATTGQEVMSPDDGSVRFAGAVGGRSVVSIDHGGGLVSTLEPVIPEVVEGQPVRRGQRVATVDVSEHCTSCLHLGARLAGEYLSPLALLGGVPRAVLLPVD